MDAVDVRVHAGELDQAGFEPDLEGFLQRTQTPAHMLGPVKDEPVRRDVDLRLPLLRVQLLEQIERETAVHGPFAHESENTAHDDPVGAVREAGDRIVSVTQGEPNHAEDNQRQQVRPAPVNRGSDVRDNPHRGYLLRLHHRRQGHQIRARVAAERDLRRNQIGDDVEEVWTRREALAELRQDFESGFDGVVKAVLGLVGEDTHLVRLDLVKDVVQLLEQGAKASVHAFEFAAEIGGLGRFGEKLARELRGLFPRLAAQFDEGNAGLEIFQRGGKGGVELGAISCLEIQLRQLDLGFASRDDRAAAVELIGDIEDVCFTLRFRHAGEQEAADLQMHARPILLGDQRINGLLHAVVTEFVVRAVDLTEKARAEGNFEQARFVRRVTAVHDTECFEIESAADA